jgi:hypothetical protein
MMAEGRRERGEAMGTWKCDDRPYEGEEQLHELANRLLLSTAPVELWHSLVMFDFGWT